MSKLLDRMIERARAPLSALQPVVPSAFSPEQPVREDRHESWSGQSELQNVFDPLARAIHSSNSARQELSGTAHLSKHLSIDDSIRLNRESQSVGKASPGESRASSARDERNTNSQGLPHTPAEEQTRASSSNRPGMNDLPPITNVVSPSPSLLEPEYELREKRQSQISDEFARSFARINQAQLSASATPATEPPNLPIEVNVSIGSIEFRSARPAVPIKRAESHSSVTLDSYLQRGKRDGR